MGNTILNWVWVPKNKGTLLVTLLKTPEYSVSTKQCQFSYFKMVLTAKNVYFFVNKIPLNTINDKIIISDNHQICSANILLLHITGIMYANIYLFSYFLRFLLSPTTSK